MYADTSSLIILPFILNKEKKEFKVLFYSFLGEFPSLVTALFIIDMKNAGRKNSLIFFTLFVSFFYLLAYSYEYINLSIYMFFSNLLI